MIAALLTFLAGMIVEGVCVLWVYSVERRHLFSASMYSMIFATTSVLGLGAAIKEWKCGAGYVLGYGAGTAIAVKWKPEGQDAAQ